MTSAQQEQGPSVIEQLAAYAATESFEKLPEAAVRAARRAILDTLGVTLAGSVEVTAERVRALVAHRRGERRGHDRGHAAARIGRGRCPRERHGGPRAGLRRPAPVAVGASIGAGPARRAGPGRAPAPLRGRAHHRVRRRGGDRSEARTGAESGPLRNGLARHVDPRRIRRGGRGGQAARALGRAHRAGAGHRRLHGERDQGELRHRLQAAARRARRALRRRRRRCSRRPASRKSPRAGACDGFGTPTGRGVHRPGIWPRPVSARRTRSSTRASASSASRPARARTRRSTRPWPWPRSTRSTLRPSRRSSAPSPTWRPTSSSMTRRATPLQGKFSMPYCVSVALLDRRSGSRSSPTSGSTARTCRR